MSQIPVSKALFLIIFLLPNEQILARLILCKIIKMSNRLWQLAVTTAMWMRATQR